MWNKGNINNSVNGEGFVIDPRLEALFAKYRAALPDPGPFDAESNKNFMPALWSRIEAKQAQTNFIGRMSRVLVTTALGASVVLGLLLSAASHQSISYFNGTYIEALTTQQLADLDPLHPDRVMELEQQ